MDKFYLKLVIFQLVICVQCTSGKVDVGPMLCQAFCQPEELNKFCDLMTDSFISAVDRPIITFLCCMGSGNYPDKLKHKTFVNESIIAEKENFLKIIVNVKDTNSALNYAKCIRRCDDTEGYRLDVSEINKCVDNRPSKCDTAPADKCTKGDETTTS